ncbi:MAG TPA: hypothetical protein VEW95_00470 [Candidatus Limnocylindrales bacterium]|nr:hypothetical protein [Candidatus Limnocylindrales bacterium]
MPDDEVDRDLARRLRAYENSVPDAPAPMTERIGRRPPWMAVAAVTAGAVLVGAFVASDLLSGPRSVGETDPTPFASLSPAPTSSPAGPTTSASAAQEPSSVPSPDPSTPAASPVPEATTAPASVTGVAWSDQVGKVAPGRVYRVTAEGGRFYALGSEGMTAVIWSSADGAAWQSVSLPFPRNWTREQVGFVYVDELAVVDGRLLAIGTVGINDYLEVVVWESTDGSSWQEVDTGAFRTEAFSVEDVSAGPGGLVVVTHQYQAGTGSAWRSTDGGSSWTEHRPPGDDLGVHAVVGTGSGYLVAGAVGETYDNVVTSSPRIWHSVDGTNWAVAGVEGSGGRGMVEQITVDGSGRWVATGTLDDRSVAWLSTDGGLTWTKAADIGPVAAASRAEFRLAGAPGGFIAFRATDPADIWTSPDGVSWTQHPTQRPSGVADGMNIGWTRGIGRVGDTVVVAGDSYSDTGSPDEWLFWVGTIQR